MKLVVMAGVLLVGSVLPAMAQNTRDSLPGVESLPEGTVQLGPLVPKMGEHWAIEADRPFGPIYCVHEGKVVCIEYMIDQADFAAGKSWSDLAGMEGLPPVDHVDITYMPEGHPGHEVPHYDVHMYFLPPEEIDAIQ